MILDSFFAQAIFTITAAGLILGKEELLYLARLSGKPLGRVMGSFQGMRMRYDLKMQENGLHKASRNVAEGLRNISSITNDFNMIKYGSTITHNQPGDGSGGTNTYKYNEATNDMIMEKEKISKMFQESKRQVEAEYPAQQQARPPVGPARGEGKFK